MTAFAQDLPFGATLIGSDRARFRLWAPGVTSVALEIADRAPIEMLATEGWHEIETSCSVGDAYRYRVSPDLAVPDPASRAQVSGVHGPSRVVDPRGYAWRNPDWAGRPWQEAVVYELHAGLYGGFAGVADRLPGLAALGITAIELMPIAAFPGTRNWGYDGVLPFAPAAAYGTPDDLKALVDRAHDLGLMILLDVVYNHFGPDGNYLPVYAPPFFTDARQTPWGAAIDFNRPEVARFFVENALYWLNEYRFDGLRLDAVHAIANQGFLDRLATEIHDAIPDRHVHLILENEANDTDRLERGYNAQWNDDLHNVLHVLLTGEDHAYYRDFADHPAERLARCLAQGFDYQGGQSVHLGAARGKPSAHLPSTRFVSFLQNHDQVGNRALGERLTQVADPAALRAAMALLLLCPQVPLLFMGEEVGSRTPFLFFTDFHDELADAVREGRRREFANFPGFGESDQRARIPDPNAEQSFLRSRPEPAPDAEEWHTLVARLLALRREYLVPYLADCRSLTTQVTGEKAVMACWQLSDTIRLTIAVNLGDRAAGVIPDATPLIAIGGNGLDRHSFAAWWETADA